MTKKIKNLYPRIGIIILHFGDIKVTQQCISSILTHETFPYLLIVVDNSGNFSTSHKQVTVLKSKKNLGFAGGMNVGVSFALKQNAAYCLLLNNDIVFEQPILNTLVTFAEKEKMLGIVGPAIKFERNKKTVYDLGGNLDLFIGRTSHTETFKRENAEPRVVQYISGCCMLVKKAVFEKIGFLDEAFFLYYEDVDFCLRAKKAGFATVVLPEVSIFHGLSKNVGKSSKLALYHQTKSALLFGKKHFPQSLAQRMFVVYQSFVFMVKNPSQRGVILNAWRDKKE